MERHQFEMVTEMVPKGDQPQAIKELMQGIKEDKKIQVLLGATGTGKTFTIANVIQQTQRKTLVMAHNKTLAGQLYVELKELFPNNRVEYYVSYFDFYQPEAYMPRTDTYIEKTAQTNQEIEMLRLSTINSLANRNDVIVVASVAAIYASVAPEDFEKYRLILSKGKTKTLKQIKEGLIRLNYQRNQIDLKPGTFRIKGDVLEIAPGYTDQYTIRVSLYGDEVESIDCMDALTGTVTQRWETFVVAPADEYIMNRDRLDESTKLITEELKTRIAFFNKENKLIEAQRIDQRTRYDMEALKEFGVCSGIENYARHLELRPAGSTPYTLFDYFNLEDKWLIVMDESHMSIPQIRGMYHTDRSRKQTLVDYGFRLPSALDNRPLNFEEFESKIDKAIMVSATPNEWEINKANNIVVQQIVRPTGLLDPVIEIRPTKNQIDDLIVELKKQVNANAKTFVTVLTIRMAEELAGYLKNRKFKVAYLHSELKTLERSKIINDLRRGIYDCIIGINLLREGLDVPEVSLIAIFDADKPGFFRSDKSLIQTIGRAARNVNGRVIMYGDSITKAMQTAIDETQRRRDIQIQYNKDHNITPTTIVKAIRQDIQGHDSVRDVAVYLSRANKSKKLLNDTIRSLKKDMLQAAKTQDYRRAADLRDMVLELEAEKDKLKK